MPLVTLNSILDNEYEHRYAVGTFNVINLNFLEAIVEAAIKVTQEFINGELSHYNDYLHLKEKVKESVKLVVKEQMNIFGS